MTTKEQERKALERIRKIVADLGEDSYVGTAFEGCFEDAEQNIENDFALSMNGRWQDAEQKVEKLERAISEVTDKLLEMNKRAEDAEQIANAKIETADHWCAKYHEADDLAVKNWNAFREQEDRADTLEQEIVKLKAKLYDLIVEK